MHDGQAVSPLVSGLVAFASALAGAVVALYGNYRLQRYLGRRLRDAEELKTRLYDLLRLTAEYWTNDHRPRSTRQEIEARIVAEQIVVTTQLMEMGNHSRSLTDWYGKTEQHRLDLIDALTGGCFQQKVWSPDPQRVIAAARSIQELVSSLNRNC